MFSRTMSIVLGKPVKMDRKNCDSDPQVDCSVGLHLGSTGYVNDYGSSVQGGKGVILVCFISPANVVAVPTADCTKMRVSEYFPFAIATYEDGKIDVVEQAYYEDDYQQYELEELEAQIAKIKEGEVPVQTAINSEPEERPLSELMKILESRIIDIE